MPCRVGVRPVQTARIASLRAGVLGGSGQILAGMLSPGIPDRAADRTRVRKRLRRSSCLAKNSMRRYAFALAHHSLGLCKINVFDPQAQAFHQAQTGAIGHWCHELIKPLHPVQNLPHFALEPDVKGSC
jgi:hypothetical protein